MNSFYDEINTRRNQIKKDWNRVLPTNELLFDRWEKAKFLGAGEGTSIYDSSLILGDIEIGENTWIGPFTVLDASGGTLIIGNYCSISSGVQIYTHDTVLWSLSGGKKERITNSTTIGDYCYIGPMSIISMGVSLGKRCVVGANSFVNKSYPDNSIIVGSPAKQIGRVHVDGNGDIRLIYDK